MKLRFAALMGALLAGPALADTPANVSLIIENDAGMVTQFHDLTQRECDAVTSLLAPRKTLGSYSGLVIGTTTLGGYPTESKPLTSRLTTARCVTATDKK